MILALLLITSSLSMQSPIDLECGPYTAPSGQVMVKLKPFAQWLNASIQWVAKEKRVVVKRDDKTVELWVGRKSARVDNMTVALTEQPVIVCGQITVPVRPVAEAFGAKVSLAPAGDAVIVTDAGREIRFALPAKALQAETGPGPTYRPGYPSDSHRQAAWVGLQQFLYALRDGRTADAESRCTPDFIETYGGRFLHPLRPFRVERFELRGWQDTPSGRLWIKSELQVRDATTRETQVWAFELTPQGTDWRLSAAVKLPAPPQ